MLLLNIYPLCFFYSGKSGTCFLTQTCLNMLACFFMFFWKTQRNVNARSQLFCHFGSKTTEKSIIFYNGGQGVDKGAVFRRFSAAILAPKPLKMNAFSWHGQGTVAILHGITDSTCTQN